MWKNELANKRDRLLSFDQMTLISDQGIIRRRTNIGQDNTGKEVYRAVLENLNWTESNLFINN